MTAPPTHALETPCRLDPGVGVPSPRVWAHAAGALILVSIVAGGFGEMYVPSQVIVSGDALATARRLVEHEVLFRVGFAGYLVEALCWYVLLRPVHRDLALLATFFRLVSTAAFAAAELFYFGAPLVLRGAPDLGAFAPEQLNGLALLALKTYGLGAGVFMVFYGVASMLHGFLIYRSRYLPRILGALLGVGGLGFVASSALFVVAPARVSSALYLPMGLAGLSLAAWLLLRGVDTRAWKERVTGVGS